MTKLNIQTTSWYPPVSQNTYQPELFSPRDSSSDFLLPPANRWDWQDLLQCTTILTLTSFSFIFTVLMIDLVWKPPPASQPTSRYDMMATRHGGRISSTRACATLMSSISRSTIRPAKWFSRPGLMTSAWLTYERGLVMQTGKLLLRKREVRTCSRKTRNGLWSG